MSDITRNAIATLREELQNERTRAEAAEAELRESKKEADELKEIGKFLSERLEVRFKELHATAVELQELRKAVDAWKAAEQDRANYRESRCGEELLQQLLEEAEEALRHA